jgi:hypothetical protein
MNDQDIINWATQNMALMEPLIRDNREYDLIGSYVLMLLLKVKVKSENSGVSNR